MINTYSIIFYIVRNIAISAESSFIANFRQDFPTNKQRKRAGIGDIKQLKPSVFNDIAWLVNPQNYYQRVAKYYHHYSGEWDDMAFEVKTERSEL